MPKLAEQDIHSLIPAERLRFLHKVTARLAAAGAPHAAALAGCCLHVRSHDKIWPAKYESAAQLASGTKHLFAAESSTSASETSLTGVAELARNLQQKDNGAAILAILGERELLDAETVALGRRIARQQLPLVLMSFSRAMPKPGDPQKRLGIPEMTVAADDAIAVYRVAEEAFWRARTGVGATWIRCAT